MEILALEDKRYAAMLAGDAKTLEGLFHDELIYTHSSGVSDTKTSYLDALRSGKVRYRKVNRSGERVRFCGDAALVTGRAVLEAEINGQAQTLNVSFLNVWTRTAAGWKFAGWQSTRLPS
jgi:ketosteroid isomerase-like protein